MTTITEEQIMGDCQCDMEFCPVCETHRCCQEMCDCLTEEERGIYKTLDEVHKQKFLEAHATGFPEAIHFVLYEFLLATIPAKMPKAQQARHRKELKGKMAECMKKCQAAAKKYEAENGKFADANLADLFN